MGFYVPCRWIVWALIYVEYKCGRIERIVSSKLDNKLKILRNFSIELK